MSMPTSQIIHDSILEIKLMPLTHAAGTLRKDDIDRILKHLSTSWRVGALITTGLTATIMLINLALAIYITIMVSESDYNVNGISSLFSSSCSTISTINRYIHLSINLIATVLLGASNYCMQCLYRELL